MSGTMTVKELITELLDYGMDEPVYIGLGSRSIPDGRAEIMTVSEFSSNITCGFGVYLNPRSHLEDADLAPNAELRGRPLADGPA